MVAVPTVLIRDADYNVIGQLDDYVKLQVIPRYNAVGAWILDLALNSSKVSLLHPDTNPGGGIIVRSNGQNILSGPIHDFRVAGGDAASGTLTVGGPDDNVILAQHTVWPDPAHAITAQTVPVWREVSTDTETIMRDLVNLNLGPGSLALRKVAALTLATNEHRGVPNGNPSFRFNTVLDALQTMSVISGVGVATDQLGFRVVQVGTGLVFQVYDSADNVDTATFSPGRGNLVDWEYRLTAPTTSYVILGVGSAPPSGWNTDSGNLATALSAYQRIDATWPDVYAETFLDLGGSIDVDDPDLTEQLDQKAQDHYDTASGQVGVSITPIDTPALTYGTDYTVGDFVTIALPYLTFQERVREVNLTFTADGGTGQLGIGTADGDYSRRTPGIYRKVADLQKKLRKATTK